MGPYARQGRQTARKSLDSKVCLVPDVQIYRYRCHQRAGALAQLSKGRPSAWPSSYPSEVIQGAPAVAVPDLQRHASEQLRLQAPAKLTMAEDCCARTMLSRASCPASMPLADWRRLHRPGTLLHKIGTLQRRRGLVSLARPPGSASPSHRRQAVPELRPLDRVPTARF